MRESLNVVLTSSLFTILLELPLVNTLYYTTLVT
nr:MAG TPA: hypothetical protein [Caudoviricetes sp.]